ncbi:MAG: amidohydrolase [Cognaticolwellia sp.]
MKANVIISSLMCLLAITIWSSHNAYAKKSAVQPPITVYTAKKIITMDTTLPTATAVAVRGNRILSVGSLADLQPWLAAYPHKIDKQFEDKVLMPGLIDPHIHTLLGAIQFGTVWITPEQWDLHDAVVPATRDATTYIGRLKEALVATKDSDKPIFITWGWSKPEHGDITRSMLDKLDNKRPIMVWQRSAHEAIFNSAALAYMKLTQADIVSHKDNIDWEKGHFFEAGFFDIVVPRLAKYLLSPNNIDSGYRRNVDYLVSGGVTTIGDLATGQVSWPLEQAAIKRNLIDKQAPFRSVIVPSAKLMAKQYGGLEKSFELINDHLSQDSGSSQVVHGKRIKLFADGAMFSQLMKLAEPGYIDGHQGEWLTEGESFAAQAKKYWQAGYRIHVHANGDAGINRTLDIFEKLQRETPRLSNSLVIEHYGYANEYINRRIARFGASVSANPFYLYALGDSYAKHGLGADRANRITPLAGLVERNVPIALHSDFGMAPARPLYLAWTAMSRETISGEKYTPPRGLTLAEALKAVTIDAAYILGLDKDIGSIESGKIADFAVLEQDPYQLTLEQLKNIKVWGTVFEGVITKSKAVRKLNVQLSK